MWNPATGLLDHGIVGRVPFPAAWRLELERTTICGSCTGLLEQWIVAEYCNPANGKLEHSKVTSFCILEG